MEKVPLLIAYVKSGLHSFVLEIFCWTDAPRSGGPAEVDSDQIETLRTINIIPCRRQPTYSKYPNNKGMVKIKKWVLYGKTLNRLSTQASISYLNHIFMLLHISVIWTILK